MGDLFFVDRNLLTERQKDRKTERQKERKIDIEINRQSYNLVHLKKKNFDDRKLLHPSTGGP